MADDKRPEDPREAAKWDSMRKAAAARQAAQAPGEQHFQHGSLERGPAAGPSGETKKPEDPKDAERREDVKKAAERRADTDAQAHLDPMRASQLAALNPGPVYYLPNQAEGNPGVQGWVFRPHQEKNPGETPGMRVRDADEFQQQVALQTGARGRQRELMQKDADARGEKLALAEGPARLRLNLTVEAHSVVDEGQLGAIAAAADGLVNALRAAGVDPQKADVSGTDF
jgi:hypothetical protein